MKSCCGHLLNDVTFDFKMSIKRLNNCNHKYSFIFGNFKQTNAKAIHADIRCYAKRQAH